MIMTLAGEFDLASLLAPCRFRKTLTLQTSPETCALAQALRASCDVARTTAVESAHV